MSQVNYLAFFVQSAQKFWLVCLFSAIAFFAILEPSKENGEKQWLN